MIQQPKYAADHQYSYYRPYSGEDLTVSTSVVSPTVPQDIRMAKVFFRGGTVRMRLDGSTPSASVGIPVYDGYEEFFSWWELKNLKLIRETQDATVYFIYYR